MKTSVMYGIHNMLLSAWLRLRCRKQMTEPNNFRAFAPAQAVIAPNAMLKLTTGLELGSNCQRNYHRGSILRMAENSELIVNGYFRFYFEADVQLFPGATLILGKGFINSNCKIRCRKSITIGDGCVIGTDVTIMDSDFHAIEGAEEMGLPIVIQDRVWIGTRCTILKGVTIGEGAIVGAGSVVTQNVPPHAIAVGSPAKVIRTDVKWS